MDCKTIQNYSSQLLRVRDVCAELSTIEAHWVDRAPVGGSIAQLETDTAAADQRIAGIFASPFAGASTVWPLTVPDVEGAADNKLAVLEAAAVWVGRRPADQWDQCRLIFAREG